MSRRPAPSVLASIVGACLAMLVGCATRTQTFAVLDGDDIVRAETVTLDVEVRGDDGAVVRTSTFRPGAGDPSLPFSLALEPRSGDASRRFEVHAVARRSDGSTVAEARVRSGYVSGRALSLRVYLTTACRDVACPDPITTCRAGACADLFVPPETLPDHPDTRFDAGSIDASGVDHDAPLIGDDAPRDAFGADAFREDAAIDAALRDDVGHTDAGVDASATPTLEGVLSASSVREGDSVTYTLTLSEAPTEDVVVTLSTDDAQLALVPSVVTFARGASDSQIVIARPVWDAAREVPHPDVTIAHAVTSTAPRYGGLTVADATLSIVDQLHVELVSVNTAGDDASRVGAEAATIGLDGRYIFFLSRSNDLVTPMEVRASQDVYLRDTVLGTTTRISTTVSGGEPDADSHCPAVADDGTTLVFYSDATDIEGGRAGTFSVDRSGPAPVLSRLPLVGCGVLNRGGNVFLQDTPSVFPGHLADGGGYDAAYVDLSTGMVTQASVNSMGQDVRFFWGDNVFYSHVSASGRFVVFSTPGDNLDASDPGDVVVHNFHVYLRDMTARTTTRISRHHGGRATCAGTYEATGSVGSRATDDGIVYFNSACDIRVDPASGADNVLGTDDVFSRDPVAQITRRVVRPVSGLRPDRHVRILSLSSDRATARLLVQSEATNLVTPTLPAEIHAFVVDPESGGMPRLATFDREGNAVLIENGQAQLSGDGRFVVFTTRAAIDPRDTNGAPDVYLAQLE